MRIAALCLLLAVSGCRAGGFLSLGSLESELVEHYVLQPSESSLYFVGMKNNAVAVPGAFAGLTGELDFASGKAWLSVALMSLATGDAGRDTNLRTHFFEVEKFPFARFELAKLPVLDSKLACGSPQSLELAGTLEIHGKSVALVLPARVTRACDGRLRVSDAKPIALNAKDLGLDPQLAVLKAVCGHEAVSAAVPISFDAVFAPAPGGA